MGPTFPKSSEDMAQMAESPSATEAKAEKCEKASQLGRTGQKWKRRTLDDDGAKEVNGDLPPSLPVVKLLEEQAPEVERLGLKS